jgi:hypothetical protein
MEQMIEIMSPRHLKKISTNIAFSKRKTTEEWLQELIDEKKFRFRYFLTLSFNKQQTCFISQYLENKHVKNVLLDFFYPNKKPTDRIRVWFFVERHLAGGFHLHILLEGMNGLVWLSENNRKVTLKKSTLFALMANDIVFDEVIVETLTNHLQTYIKRLGKGKQSVDMRSIGNVETRIQYVNKSLSGIEFSNWEHIDFQNSDL